MAANEKRGPGDNFVIEQLRKVNVPVFLIVNKIDTMEKQDLLEAIVSYENSYPLKRWYRFLRKKKTILKKW